MACKILNKKTGGRSLLAEELQNIYKLKDSQETEDFLLRQYSYFLSPNFIEQFGDWINEDIDDSTGNIRLNEVGEPKIYTEDSNYFVVDKQGNKLFIPINEYKVLLDVGVRDILEFREDVANQTLFYIFRKYGLESGALDFDKLKEVNIVQSIIDYFKETKNNHLSKYRNSKSYTGKGEEAINRRYNTFIDIAPYFRKDVENYLKKLNISLEDIDINDSTSQRNMEDNALGYDILSSFVKNSKDNATAKIKLMVSFLPYFYKNGRAVISKYLFSQKFVPFDKVWSDLLPVLTGVPKTFNSQNQVNDSYNIIKERLNTESIHKPYLKVLSKILENATEDTKTQFVNTFSNLDSYNHSTIEVDGNEGYRNITLFNAAESAKKSNKILNEWSYYFKDLYIRDKTDGLEFDYELFKKNQNNFEEYSLNTYNKLKKRDDVDITTKEDIINNILKLLEKYGISLEKQEFNYFLHNNGELPSIDTEQFFKRIDNLFNGIHYINKALSNSKIRNKLILGDYTTIYKDFSDTRQTIIDDLAESQASYNFDISEDTLKSGDVTKWKYSLSNYLNDTLNIWKSNPEELENYLSIVGNKNSRFIPHLLDEGLKKMDIIVTNTFQEKGKASEGTNNVDTKKSDAIARDIYEALSHKVSSNLPIYQTPVPADKSTGIKFAIDYFIDTNARYENNQLVISDEVINTFIDYFEDDYSLAVQAYVDIKKNTNIDGLVDTSKLNMYFHTNKNGYAYELIDSENNVLLETNNIIELQEAQSSYNFSKKKLAGNAFRNFMFPSFDPSNKKNILPPGLFYSNELIGMPIVLRDSFNANQRKELVQPILDIIERRIQSTIAEFIQNSIISDKRVNKNIDRRIWNYYKGNTINLAADYFFNTTVAQIEYQKLFSGSVLKHKDIIDYFKRISGTYIDGLGLRLGLEKDDHLFRIAILEDSYKSSEFVPKQYQSYYSNINQADAQAYITPKRWKFLLKRLGKWDDAIHNPIYDKIINNQHLTQEELRLLSAKPLKGVYRSLIQGRPVYLKYSQAILIPQAFSKTPLENLLAKMERDNIDEVVFTSGIKIGAFSKNIDPEEVLNNNDLKLNSLTLNNRFWKLQQDLPTKGIKPTKLGTQIQKNILLNIDFNGDYNGQTGAELYTEINNLISALSDFGLTQLERDLGLGYENYTIQNWNRFKNALVDQLINQDIPENIINAIRKELTPFVIPQGRDKLISVIFSIINKSVIDIETNGGSLIQMSNYGLSNIEAINSGVYMIKPINTLAEPRVVIKDGKKTILPGQVFISASFISKYIPNWREYSPEELFGENGLIDARVLNIVGYRIPNQGTSSNDALEVVGILPDAYEDTIIAYTGITEKTGSDFDIDKMFMMMPNMEFETSKSVYKKGYSFIKNEKLTKEEIIDELRATGYSYIPEDYQKVFIEDILMNSNEPYGIQFRSENNINSSKRRVKYIEYNKNIPILENRKAAIQNRLVELYHNILTSPIHYEDLITPLDFPFIKENIEKINGIKIQNFRDLEMFSSIKQIDIKYDYLAGKYGIGQIANHLVDHSRGQTSNISLNTYLGWGNKDSEGNTIFDKNINGEYISEKFKPAGKEYETIKIVNSISAILNAYVDIAKDPYITKGNWNTLTANIGMMLIRAGVHPFRVNAFLAQPIIKRLVIEKSIAEAKLSGFESSRDIELKLQKEYSKLLREELEKEGILPFEANEIVRQANDNLGFDIVPILSNLELNTRIPAKNYDTLVRHANSPKNNIEFLFDQLVALKEFKYLQKYSKEFRLQVETGKTGEVGAGKNPIDTMITKNNISSLLTSNTINNVESRYYNDYIDKTFLATYYNNSVGFVSKLIEGNPKLFLTYTEKFRDIYNDFASETSEDREYLNDDQLGYIIENGIYTSIMSDFKLFSYDNIKNNYNDLFFNLYNDIKQLKDSKIDNYFIEQLELKLDEQFRFIGINNLRNHPSFYQDRITQGWLELFKTHPDIANRLVKYAFYQSGFKNNANQIYKFIPNEYFIENNINGYIDSVMDNIPEMSFQQIKENIFKHNWENTQVVPRMRLEDIYVNDKKIKQYNDNYILINSLSNRHVGESNNKLVFPPFISFYNKEDNSTNLFKLEGYLYKNDEYPHPLYLRTNKLGYKSIKGQFHEYGSKGKLSVYDLNNLSEESIENIEFIREGLKNADFIPASQVVLSKSTVLNPIHFEKNNDKLDNINPFKC